MLQFLLTQIGKAKKSISDFSCTDIKSGTDLDTLTTQGLYGCLSGTVAASLSHCPVNGSFTMLVMRKDPSTARTVQVIFYGYRIYCRDQTSTGFLHWFEYKGTDTNA